MTMFATSHSLRKKFLELKQLRKKVEELERMAAKVEAAKRTRPTKRRGRCTQCV
jgi:hypothetical protein